ncbi:MAG: serine/threonine-protein kinase, partial [Myxococcota bacterium]
KTLREDRELTPDIVDRLLKEARVTGRLEHPNIIPVHEIQVLEGGAPQILMKKVEGRSWTELLRDPMTLRELHQVGDILEWNLGVFLNVCRALEFAHAKGVIHRDVKPSNVMIGRYGEVYLLDWGIAALMDPDPAGELPSLTDSRGGGTPAFMAPEQLERQGDTIGPWTDIYLAGATLYHVLSGRPPHLGESSTRSRRAPRARAVAALPRSVPAELAEIVLHAMDPDPAERFASMSELRYRIEAYLRHRGSVRLSDDAVELHRAASEAWKNRQKDLAERSYVEAAFAYRAALEAWDGNEAARVGADRLARERIEAALEDGKPVLAESLMATLSTASPDLRARVADARYQDLLRAGEAERLRADTDRTVGVGFRRFLVIGLGTLWMAWWIGVALYPPATVVPLMGLTGGFVSVGAGVVIAGRKSMLDNRLNRHISYLSLATLGLILGWLVVAMSLREDMTTVYVVIMLLLALASAAATVTIDVRSAPIAIGWVLGMIVLAARPEFGGWVLVGASVVQLASMGFTNWMLTRQKRAQQLGDSS